MMSRCSSFPTHYAETPRTIVFFFSSSYGRPADRLPRSGSAEVRPSRYFFAADDNDVLEGDQTECDLIASRAVIGHVGRPPRDLPPMTCPFVSETEAENGNRTRLLHVAQRTYYAAAPRRRTSPRTPLPVTQLLVATSSALMSSPASHFPPGSVVAVTGANGYIGSHIVKQLLAKGFRVRAVVRDPSNAAKVAHLKGFPHSEHLELAKGELKEEDYQKAFAGAHAVIHTATPYIYSAPDPDRDIVQPAIAGALSPLCTLRSLIS